MVTELLGKEWVNILSYLLNCQIVEATKGKCHECGLYFQLSDLMEVHHLDGNHNHNKWDNLALLHQHCHDQVHQGMHDKH